MTSGFRRLSICTPVALRLAPIVALALAGLAAPAAHAQEQVPAASLPPPSVSTDADGNLNLPNNPQFFGKMDPDHRHATAIVNSEIITGTDIDQRFALFSNANNGKIGPEELERLRAQVVRNLIDETLQIQEAKAADITIE